MGRQVVCDAAIYFAEGYFTASPAPSPCSSQPPVAPHPLSSLGKGCWVLPGCLGAAWVFTQPRVRKVSAMSMPQLSKTEKGKSNE